MKNGRMLIIDDVSDLAEVCVQILSKEYALVTTLVYDETYMADS